MPKQDIQQDKTNKLLGSIELRRRRMRAGRNLRHHTNEQNKAGHQQPLRQRIKDKRKQLKFTIEIGSSVIIMPKNLPLYNTEDILPIKDRYQDVNKNVEFLGKVREDTEYNKIFTKIQLLITKSNSITPLLRVNCLNTY